MTSLPQFDSDFFLSQAFWLSIFFFINFIFHSILIIPFLKNSVMQFINAKRILKDNIDAIKNDIQLNEENIEEIELKRKNYLSDIHLKAEETADKDFVYKMGQIRSSINYERQKFKQSIANNKKDFIKEFSNSLGELSDMICKKMENKDG